MVRPVRSFTCMAIAMLLSATGAGCTPVEKGIQEGVSGGLAAALAALIETPITFALDEAFGGEE